jgi:hypothetical protein
MTDDQRGRLVPAYNEHGPPDPDSPATAVRRTMYTRENAASAPTP